SKLASNKRQQPPILVGGQLAGRRQPTNQPPHHKPGAAGHQINNSHHTLVGPPNELAIYHDCMAATLSLPCSLHHDFTQHSTRLIYRTGLHAVAGFPCQQIGWSTAATRCHAGASGSILSISAFIVWFASHKSTACWALSQNCAELPKSRPRRSAISGLRLIVLAAHGYAIHESPQQHCHPGDSARRRRWRQTASKALDADCRLPSVCRSPACP